MIITRSGMICNDVVRDNQESIASAKFDISTEVALKGVHDIADSCQRNDVFHFEINKAALKPVNIRNNGQKKE